jgi:DNA-binding MarR family transcriptional regulator
MDNTSPPAHGDQLRELALVLHDLSWRIARLGPAQVGVDPLPASELAVLRAIMDHPDRSVSEVAESLSMQASNVSTAIRGLTERGLVNKRVADNDRRIYLLAPTPRALRERDQIENAIASTLSAALGAIPESQLNALRKAAPALQALTRQVGPHSW